MKLSYKDFVSQCKIERQVVRYIKDVAFSHNYVSPEEASDSCRIFVQLSDSACALIKIGDVEALYSGGFNILATHTDSPRIDLKTLPITESNGSLLLKTYYYGDIKKYQWVTRPLTLIGTVSLFDGRIIEVSIGDQPEDPKFTINDLLPHLSIDQLKQPAESFISGEDLCALAGLVTSTTDKSNDITHFLSKFIGLRDTDEISCIDLSLVPSGPACDIGFEADLIGAYGHDARSCVYASLESMVSSDTIKSKSNCIALFFDSEEKGSFGRNSAQSNVVEYLVALINRNRRTKLQVTSVLRESVAIGADVAVAIDPIYDDVSDKMNAAKLGEGICLSRSTGGRGKFGGNTASIHIVNSLLIQMRERKIQCQFHEVSKTDKGGGGTISKHLARLGIETIDCGPAVLSMHSPLEVLSVADLLSTIEAYTMFLNMNFDEVQP